MNAFRGLSRGVVPEMESAWLFKIAHNVCLSRRRSSWRRGKVEAPNNFEVLQEVIPGREQVADELIRLQDVLEEMPENQRRAILLREWQGMTYREISSELGLTQAATETLIFRARRALAQGLDQNGDTWKGRLGKGSDFGGVIGSLCTLLSGGSAMAVKVAATAVVVATTAVASSPNPTTLHSQRATDAKPAIAKRATPAPRQFTAARSARATAVVTAPSKPSARKSGSKPAPATQRVLPKPVSVPTFGDQPETPAPPPAAPPLETPQPEPAPVVQAPPAPAPDRKPQAADPVAEPPPTAAGPAPAPQPDPEPEPDRRSGVTAPGHEDKQGEDAANNVDDKQASTPDESGQHDRENSGNVHEKRGK
jgi:RNA polymerase sigma factor (sigma-70 family)